MKILIPLVTALALVLAACGGSPGDTAGHKASTSTALPPPATATAPATATSVPLPTLVPPPPPPPTAVPPAPTQPPAAPPPMAAPSLMHAFGNCIEGWGSAATLETMLQLAAMQGRDDPHLRSELQDTYTELNSCVGIGAATASEGGVSSHCSSVRFAASRTLTALQLGPSPALTAALAELNAFLARAC